MLVKENKPDEGSPLSGSLIFYQNQVPSLNTGNGTITVKQTVKSTDGKTVPETTYINSNVFAVNGPRFTLPNGAISSVFPPESVQGEYGNVLPHVCFNRATLPWERWAATRAPKELLEATDQAPWLGLIVVYDTDPVVHELQTDLAALMKINETGTTFFPQFKLDEYTEKPTDQCMVIDIPISLFNKIAPSKEDLPWLAHVREIRPSNKQSAQYLNKLKAISTDKSLPKISTVIANRLPLPGGKTTAYLVSFENWADYLPASDGSQSPKLSAGIKTIRMVMLNKWDIYAINRQQTFSDYLLNLNKADDKGMLQLHHEYEADDADKALRNAFRMGYVALNHHTRQGVDTVSWYRGPFLPYSPGGEINIPVNGPDTCTEYNPQTGMFDVSHAAAWQLGRLLALQNGNFAKTLYNWKKSNVHTVISNFEEEIIKKTLKEIVDKKPTPDTTAETANVPDVNPELSEMINKSLNIILSQFITNKDANADNAGK